MAKKTKLPEQKQTITAQLPSKKSFEFTLGNMLPLAACVLYFAVHFIPDFDGYDAMGAQWVYMVALDALIILYILGRKNDYRRETAQSINNLFSKLYLAFFVLAGISTITAINPTEAWVCYVRMIATVVAYFNITILMNGRVHLMRILAQILSLILLVESYQAITKFFEGLPNVNQTEGGLTLLVMSLKGQAGNKNIFAAGLAIKIPFVIYCIHRSKLPGKILNVVIFLTGVLAIFIVNARASYLSLLLTLLMYIAFCIILYVKERKLEQSIYRIAMILIPVIVAFFISQMEFSGQGPVTDASGKPQENFGTVTERFATLAQTQDESNQVRFRLWTHALDYTKHHPIIGCGIGNWKIASIPYQRTITNDLYVPIHSHNDFLEVFAELGIPGGLLYGALFVCLTVFTWRTFYSKASDETKLVSVFSLMAIATYTTDAFFNFPLERPISQVFFAFLAALTIGSYIQGRREAGEETPPDPQRSAAFKPVYGLVSLLLLIPSFYVTYLTYKSLIIQRNVLGDFNNEPLKLDWKEVVPSFPSIPNLSATAQPIEAIKGRYLYEAKKYDEALVLLDKGRAANPVIGYSEFLKAGIYFTVGKYDSAKRNATIAFYMRPKAKTYFQTLVAVLAKIKDTASIKKAFLEYDKYRHHSYGWNLYLLGMENAERDQGKVLPSLLSAADSGLSVFPGDTDLVVRRREIASFVSATANSTAGTNFAEAQKYFALGVKAFGGGVAGTDNLQLASEYFLKSFSINKGDFSALENAAICFFNMRQYQKSITYFDRELSMKLSGNGKPEYFKAIALINLGKKDEGCALMQIAYAKKYPGADVILKNNCGK